MDIVGNEKIRIFCVITQGELGGAQQFVTQLAHQLNPDRFTLHVVWGGSSVGSLGSQLPPHATYATAQHLVRPISPLSDFRAIGELRKMIADFRPDIVLCISSKAGFIGSRAAHGLRKQLPHMRIIYRIGGWTFNDPWPAWKKKLYVWLEKFSARWKDTIIVNNMHDLNQAKSLGIHPRGQLMCIYNGIEPYLEILPREQSQTVLAQKIPEPYRQQPHDWIVGTIANFYPAKDLLTLIRAAARISTNVRFVVIGTGAMKAQLQQAIDQYGLRNRFFLVGSMPEAYRYLSAFDIFVLPSVKEGFPWSVLEAMAAKIPIVATRVGAIPEILEDHVSGLLVAPGQPEQLAQGIIELLEHDKLRQELAIQAHQQLIARFSLREMITQYERLFLR